MIRSMTGFSQTAHDENGTSLSFTLKGTNHRYLDLQTRLPAGYEFLDSEIRKLVRQAVRRGHLEIIVGVEAVGEAALRIDRKLLDAYLNACRKIHDQFGIQAEPDVIALLRIPGMIGGGQVAEAERNRLVPSLAHGLARALAEFNVMREREGAALASDLADRLANLQSLVSKVQSVAESMPGAFRERLEKRVRELLQGTGIEPSRLAQEVAFQAMRCDITEELTRLGSHTAQAEQLLSEGDDAGKRLDFLLQEMNREANTILSKTADVPGAGDEIQNAAIAMKLEIEKLREQVQNVE